MTQLSLCLSYFWPCLCFSCPRPNYPRSIGTQTKSACQKWLPPPRPEIGDNPYRCRKVIHLLAPTRTSPLHSFFRRDSSLFSLLLLCEDIRPKVLITNERPLLFLCYPRIVAFPDARKGELAT